MRNPNWDARTDYRPAYVDAIDIQEGNSDAVSSSRRILSGSHVIQGDGTAPAPIIKQALSRNKSQIAFIPGGGYRMIAMNSSIKPFGNLDVRKAVLAASDRTALQSRVAAPRRATSPRTSCRRRSRASTTRAA